MIALYRLMYFRTLNESLFSDQSARIESNRVPRCCCKRKDRKVII